MTTPLPEHGDHSPGEAIIRVSTSHRVDARLTREVVADPLVDLDVALEHPDEDAFTSVEEMHEVAHAFRDALNVIGDRFPRIERVHVFASVQPGMALLLGAQISKTMHPPVQTYQYIRNADDALLHVPAVLINGPKRPEPLPLTAREEDQAGRDREQLTKDLERMKAFAAWGQAAKVTSWISGVLSSPAQRLSFCGDWLDLPAIHDTPLLRTRVDVSTRTVGDSFRLVVGGQDPRPSGADRVPPPTFFTTRLAASWPRAPLPS